MSPRSSAAASSHRPGKTVALENARGVGRQQLELAPAQDEPVELLIVDAPDEIFADAVAAVDVELGVQVVAGAAGSHLGHQLGRLFDVIVGADARLAAARRVDQQQGVGLRLVVQVKPDRRIVGTCYSRRGGFVGAQPA